ncbi:glycosyltransferase family 2 protein [Psychrobacter sp. BI730]|uniref:glycosyltransferase family 2 protein n=1 Tax=Psychrobacter sp. BI730 TaxID=2705463 RepID=UPI0015C82064|nr:glycosyltransferase family 2 protein [Psychrobacter sp. BI730]NYR08865.1 glycosyltransferase [Psychrobacter sp. BI730]
MKKNCICAVVVTFNRKVLLKNTLDQLVSQTENIDKIFLIDNASSDDTKFMLESEGFLDRDDISYHLLENNTGGAGGFYEGMKRAFEYGADWIWLMDDDGYPESKECLKELLKACSDFDVFGPLVLSNEKNGETAFPFVIKNYSGIIDDREKARDFSEKRKDYSFIPDSLCPFNGVLVSREVVEKVGLPKPELFIWGDEMNYWMRCVNANFRIATITSCYFLHPQAESNSVKTFFGSKYFDDPPSPLKLYCYCRNHIYNVKTLKSRKYIITFSFKTVWFYTFTRPSFKKLKISLRSLKDGYTSNFNNHSYYIGKNFDDF